MSFGPFSFGMQRPPPPPPAPGTRRGQNIELVLEATPFDILLQETLNLKYTRRIPCPECGGKGADLVRCIDCGGYGIRTETVQANVNMTITQSVACERCQSTGYVKENACDSCGGTGLTIEEVETNINLHGLPPDYNWSEQIATVFRGQGNHGPNKGPAGDLVVVLKPVFPNPNNLAEDDRELLRKVKASVYNESN
jgi:molecular chaperone DnaJ